MRLNLVKLAQNHIGKKIAIVLLSICTLTAYSGLTDSMSDKGQLMKQLKYLKKRSQNQQSKNKQMQGNAQSMQGRGMDDNSQSQPISGFQYAQNENQNNQNQNNQNQNNQANQQDDSKKVKVKQSRLHQQAFRQMTQQLLPLTPSDIKRLPKMFNDVRRAADRPAEEPPKPTSSSLMVDLSPGAAPPVIRLSGGFVSTLVFLDQTGSPWPIKAYDIGNPDNFNVHWDKKSNMLMIQAMGDYRSANLAVRLKGKNTPVIITLMPGQKSVDYRVDLHIPGAGPNAKPQTGNNMPSKPSNILLNILDGVAPQNARRLNVSGGDAQVWRYHNKLYVRTKMTILSPSWKSVMTSTDGTHAYELSPTPVILMSHHGQTLRMRIEGID